ncbi:MAG: bifunctional RNase H/acid phosphatase [Nocardioides sp.]|nr:bifunctional RNase H/acid phosphatase [Nocardioides sp.]
MSRHRSVLIEADGGSRGNPGPSAYGAVLKDAETGEVIAEDGTTIGVATNNVAEYSGLIAGLRLAEEFAPEADIEVRMDSKLVVEQMSGRWKIKHPDMRPLAMEANRLAPFGTTYTWIPRAKNAYADRLANEALDGVRSGVSVPGEEPPTDPNDSLAPSPVVEQQTAGVPVEPPARGWAPRTGATTLVLVRHGATPLTAEKRFSGSGGTDPGLTDEGRAQMRTAAEVVAPLAAAADGGAVLVASPLRRARESADVLAERLGADGPLAVVIDDDLAEIDFGSWEGLTFAEVAERDPDLVGRWRVNAAVAPPGGESLEEAWKRVLAARDRILTEHAGRTVVVVAHVTPIKLLVADAVGAGAQAAHRMELAPAAVCVVAHHTDGTAALRLFNAVG